jgi:hypothetical protein
VITVRDVERLAEETGFRPEIVEKVLRLHGILERLDNHESTREQWLLKGGTALNLLHLDVPRLSVDIDVNFIGAAELDLMQRMRPEFERALASACEREGCSVRRTPGEHAGGKIRLRFPSVLGGSQNLEVDVSYVARVPLLGMERRSIRYPPASTLRVPTLNLEELAAGKFTALLQRSVARDAFDAASLLDLAPDLTSRPGFRLAFVCSVAGSRSDARALRPRDEPISARGVEQELMPVLRRRDGAAEGEERDRLLAWMRGRLQAAMGELLAWSDEERRFLDRLLDDGEIAAEDLHSDPEVQSRVRSQPMLRWKAQNVREHRGRA